MKKLLVLALSVGFFLGNMIQPLWAEHLSAGLILGDRTFPLLRIWQFMDRVVNPRLFISTTANPGEDTPTLLYSRVPPGVTAAHSPFSSNVRSEGNGGVVGGFLYAENEGQGVAYGANTFATTYSGAPAIGLEVNGLNFSGNASAAVRGIDIVNGGNAPTEWALGIETFVSQPEGKPRVGIMLAGPNNGFPHTPASETGILIDDIDSGEAIRIQADNRIAFNKEGTIYIKYNPRTNRIEFYNGTKVKFAISMG
jgi:hypothetical protein